MNFESMGNYQQFFKKERNGEKSYPLLTPSRNIPKNQNYQITFEFKYQRITRGKCPVGREKNQSVTGVIAMRLHLDMV